MPACVERAQPDASALWTAAAANALECNGYDAVLTTAILTTPPNEELLPRPKEGEGAAADCAAGQCRTICVSKLLPPSMQRDAWSFQDFDVTKQLYRGKLSIVYSAVDRQSGRQVVLKLYRKRKLSALNWCQVEREIKLHIKLNHSSIIKLYSVFEDDKLVYMVLEQALGGDLFDALNNAGGRLSERAAVRAVLVPTLQALEYMHNKGIVHRDIKPENILLSGSLGRGIKLADFGMAINQQEERPVTRVGTLDYMAPEVLICPDKTQPQENKHDPLIAYSTQVDSWAMGVLAYELLTGHPPFENESRSQTYDNIMYTNPSFSNLPVELSSEAKSFVKMALSKSAATRPSIAELYRHPWIVRYTSSDPEPPLAVDRAYVAPRSAPLTLSQTVSAILDDTCALPGPGPFTIGISCISDPETSSAEASQLNPKSQVGVILPAPPSTPCHSTASPRISVHQPSQLGQGGRRIVPPPPTGANSPNNSGRLHVPSLLSRPPQLSGFLMSSCSNVVVGMDTFEPDAAFEGFSTDACAVAAGPPQSAPGGTEGVAKSTGGWGALLRNGSSPSQALGARSASSQDAQGPDSRVGREGNALSSSSLSCSSPQQLPQAQRSDQHQARPPGHSASLHGPSTRLATALRVDITPANHGQVSATSSSTPFAAAACQAHGGAGGTGGTGDPSSSPHSSSAARSQPLPSLSAGAYLTSPPALTDRQSCGASAGDGGGVASPPSPRQMSLAKGGSGALGLGGTRMTSLTFARQGSAGLPLSPSSLSGRHVSPSTRPGPAHATGPLVVESPARSFSTPANCRPSADAGAASDASGPLTLLDAMGSESPRYGCSPTHSSSGALPAPSQLHASQDSLFSSAIAAAVAELETIGSFAMRTRSMPGGGGGVPTGLPGLGLSPTSPSPGRAFSPSPRPPAGRGVRSPVSRCTSRLGAELNQSRLSNAGTHSPTLDSGSNALLKTFPKLALSSSSMRRVSSRSRDGRSPLQLLRDESLDSVDRQDSLTLDFNPPLGIPTLEPTTAKSAPRRAAADGAGIVGGGSKRVVALQQGAVTLAGRQASDGLLLQALPADVDAFARRSIGCAKQTGQSKIEQGAVVSKIAQLVKGR